MRAVLSLFRPDPHPWVGFALLLFAVVAWLAFEAGLAMLLRAWWRGVRRDHESLKRRAADAPADAASRDDDGAHRP
jgi:hypothetical protein